MSWPLVKLSDVCLISIGKTPLRANSNYWGKGNPWLSIRDMSQGIKLYNTKEEITELGVKESNIKLVSKGTVLFSFKLSIGKIGIAQSDMYTNEAIAALPIKNRKVLCEEYLMYALSKIEVGNTTDRAVMGATLNKKKLENIKIALPPLNEQKRIAAILDKADAVRRKRNQAIELSEQLLRSVFLNMFGDPVTNLKGLPTSSLIEVSKKVTDGTHQSPVWSETGIPFLFISNIVNNEISFQVDKYITEKDWMELTKNSPIEKGDVLYTTVGSYGNAALVKENTRFCFQRHIAHIKPIKKIIHPTFLWAMMNSPGIKKQADKQARGIAQKTLNLRELKQFIIFVPPMSKQIEFVNIVSQHKTILDKLIVKSSLSDNIFSSLIQQAFSGELSKQTKVESA
ncbi:MAG: restriction endonuclease subunit S [Tatlockia sp.]|nr:restriction endonuclease subunit S [Tatlockia sp.]